MTSNIPVLCSANWNKNPTVSCSFFRISPTCTPCFTTTETPWVWPLIVCVWSILLNQKYVIIWQNTLFTLKPVSSGQFSRDFVHKFLPLSTVYFDKEKGGEIKWTLATTVTTNRSTTSSEKLPPVRHKIKYVLIQWLIFSKLYRMEPRQNSFILLLWPDLLWHHQCYRLSCLFIGLKAWILTITCVWTMKGYFEL